VLKHPTFFSRLIKRIRVGVKTHTGLPGANPTIVSYNASAVKIYNASAVKIYNATSSLVLFT
jgi:hypothetical protein